MITTKSVLNIGSCAADNGLIEQTLQRHFNLAITHADTEQAAWPLLKARHWDLVLVNRIFDRDGLSGLDFIQRIKSDRQMNTLSVMLVSNFQDYQDKAVSLGALPGIGKSQLQAGAAIARFESCLGTARSSS